MEEYLLTDVTPIIGQLQVLLDNLEKRCHITRPKKTKSEKSGTVLPKIGKPKHPYSDKDSVNTSFSMPSDMLVQLNNHALKLGKSRSQVIVETLVQAGIIGTTRTEL
jgi:hypothetical protein